MDLIHKMVQTGYWCNYQIGYLALALCSPSLDDFWGGFYSQLVKVFLFSFAIFLSSEWKHFMRMFQPYMVLHAFCCCCCCLYLSFICRVKLIESKRTKCDKPILLWFRFDKWTNRCPGDGKKVLHFGTIITLAFSNLSSLTHFMLLQEAERKCVKRIKNCIICTPKEIIRWRSKPGSTTSNRKEHRNTKTHTLNTMYAKMS